MSRFTRQQIRKADDDDEKKDKVTRLVDLLVKEVSLVDRGANGQTLLMRKQGAVKMTKAMKKATLAAIASVTKIVAACLAVVKGSGESDTATGVPQALSSKLAQAVSMLRSMMSSAAQKADGEEEDINKSDDTPEEKARKLLWNVMDEISAGALRTPKEQKDIDSIVGMLKTSIAKVAEELDTEELEKAYLPKSTKKALEKGLDALIAKLGELSTSVDAAKVDDGDNASTSIPPAFSKSIKQVADKLDGLVKKYPAVKADEGSDADDDDDSDDDDDDAGDDAGTEDTNKGGGAAAEAHKILSAALGKLQPGKPVDESVYQALDKARNLLGNAAGTPGDSGDADNAGKDKAKKAADDVAKKGAKLSKERRKKFQEALKILSKLFDEVIPETERSSWPQSAKKSDDAEDVNKRAGGADDKMKELEKKVEDTESKLEGTEVELRKARRALAKELRKAQPSNAADVDQIPNEDDDGDDDGNVAWPSDLNSQETF